MMNNAMLKVRVSEELKAAVAQAASECNLDMSSFIRLVLTRATKASMVPNAATQAAIRELSDNNGERADNIDDFGMIFLSSHAKN
ncbi:type II toxin-antitoxin system RelB/DinJ family antitoxin [Leminorella grimontii]|uniref:type II toxin-antitoxin system RelB/DinJ family antitoxin n=1 Tax=Leminorella grimontii TaxID=82981 RepID=UPI00321FDC3C